MRKRNFLVALAALGVCLSPLSAVAATPSTPDANICSDLVTYPKVLAEDRMPNGSGITPRANDSGTYTPVVVVHGWTGTLEHTSPTSSNYSLPIDRYANGYGGVKLPSWQPKSSFIGTLQAIPGVRLYTFEYNKYSTRWVKDENIAPRLAKALTCLTNAYKSKAVVVGHSMGGLTMREALSYSDENGNPISERVAHAITLGTPNTGSDILRVGHELFNKIGNTPGLRTVHALIAGVMKNCAKDWDNTGEGCMVGLPYTQAALAMIPGSKELQNLPSWPANIPYTALAGDIKFGGVSFFGWNSQRLLDVGDVAVLEPSALAGSHDTLTAKCEYGVIGIFTWRGISIGEWFRGYRNISLIDPPGPGRQLASPCYHNNLMSEVNLVKRLVERVKPYANQPVALSPKLLEGLKAKPTQQNKPDSTEKSNDGKATAPSTSSTDSKLGNDSKAEGAVSADSSTSTGSSSGASSAPASGNTGGNGTSSGSANSSAPSQSSGASQHTPPQPDPVADARRGIITIRLPY